MIQPAEANGGIFVLNKACAKNFLARLMMIILAFNGSVSFGQLYKQWWHFGTTNKGLHFDHTLGNTPFVTLDSYTPL